MFTKICIVSAIAYVALTIVERRQSKKLDAMVEEIASK